MILIKLRLLTGITVKCNHLHEIRNDPQIALYFGEIQEEAAAAEAAKQKELEEQARLEKQREVVSCIFCDENLIGKNIKQINIQVNR